MNMGRAVCFCGILVSRQSEHAEVSKKITNSNIVRGVMEWATQGATEIGQATRLNRRREESIKFWIQSNQVSHDETLYETQVDGDRRNVGYSSLLYRITDSKPIQCSYI
ncbi:hypothetical protein GQ44DRAFT_827968 [Phaeosphaeriaceae sp. PMI808]|nr:hypothetical protein GQ44DRAFT_827968 [Phaeosphaeriaceae sp. PMI808]